MENYSNIKKEIELFWVQLFQKECYYPFRIIKATESPDFIIRYLSQDIGLEVTNIYKDNVENKGSRLKAKESFQELILNKAKEKYNSESFRPIRLHVLFSPDFNTNRIDPNKVSHTLVEFLSRIKLKKFENTRYSSSSNNWGEMYRYFSAIYVSGLSSKSENYWTTPDFGFTPPITKELLVGAKKNKEEKLLNIYRKTVLNNWLLLVSDGRYQSSSFDKSNINIHPIKSGFDKIFLLLYPYNIVQELKVY